MAEAQPPQRNLFVQLSILTAVVAIWTALHWAFRDVLIFHDAWKHNFPEVYSVARNSACGQFAYWFMSPDTGAPTVIFSLNISLTQPLRVLLINWWACSRPAPFDAMLFYEFYIFAIYLTFALGMFILGRILFRHWLSAVYLAAATLFAGLCVESIHSDQHVVLVFWMPWCAAAWALAHRNAGTPSGIFYVNVATIFFCVALGDQEPHVAALPGGCALLIYAGSCVEQCRRLLSRWVHLWPAAIFLCVSLAGFFVIKDKIFDYSTSQHIAIKVDPSLLGATGFVQPSAIFGMLFPLTLTSVVDQVDFNSIWRGPIYRPDTVIFYLGTLPLLLLLSLISRRGIRGAVLGWLIFTLLMLLVSLQDSRLYLALFHLPFFDLFRNYFFYFNFALAGLLVLSGYGFDRLLTASAEDRKAILRVTLRWTLLAFAFGAAEIVANAVPGRGLGGIVMFKYGPAIAIACIIIAAFLAVGSGLSLASGVFSKRALAVVSDGRKTFRAWGRWGVVLVLAASSLALIEMIGSAIGAGLRSHLSSIAGDAVVLVTAFGLWGWALRRPDFRIRHAIGAIIVLAVTQSVHVVGAYGLLAQPAREIFDSFGMSEALLTPYSNAELASPGNIKRVPCPTNAACYLAQRDAASLKQDVDGTFLRHRLNPAFVPGLSPETLQALASVSHPILWASATLEPVESVDSITKLLEAHKADIAGFLSRATYVVGAPQSQPAERATAPVNVSFTDLQRGPNRISFRYRTDAAAIINLAITNAPGWNALVNGTPAPLISGNLDTIALRVPTGEGRVALAYDDWGSRFFFWSRWLMDALAIVGIGLVAWRGRRVAA